MVNLFDFSIPPLEARSQLLDAVDKTPLAYRKWLATYYPDAHVRRAYLKSIGVIFADESSFCNLGFLPVPNSPSETHIYIGKNVSIAPNVMCVTESDANNGREINEYPYVAEHLTKKGDITIDDEVWLGAGVIILPGVHIGRCAIIGAGTVMTKDAQPYGVYAGVPGRKIRDLRQDEHDAQ